VQQLKVLIDEEDDMAKKLFVGNLAFSVTDTQLQKLFEPHGIVKSVKVISDKTTGRSRGYGFVEMSSEDEARRATEALNGTQLGGRTLIVNEAHPQERRAQGPESRRGYGRFSGSTEDSERQVLHRHAKAK
jgi:cold-inducible RNA-binding protein